jgi:hypothetical protein
MVLRRVLVMIILLTLTMKMNSKDSISGLIAIFRHDATKPITNIPNLPNFESDFEQMGDLTLMGIRRQFNLGQMLRNTYPTLFPKAFIYHSLNITTSSSSKSISSALSMVSGIYRDVEGLSIDTPKIPDNYLPYWNDDPIQPPFQGDFSLPNGMILAPVISYNDYNNFLFKADVRCLNISQASMDSFKQEESFVFESLKDAYDIFKSNKFSIQELYGDKSMKDSLEKFGEISYSLKSLLYRDPQNRLKNFSYAQQAHMIFVNGILPYLRFSKNSLRKYYLTPLINEWIKIIEGLTGLETVTSSANLEIINTTKFSKVQLFHGNSKNLAALLLELFDDQIPQKILEIYLKLKADASKVESQGEFDQFLEEVKKEYPVINLDFGSNLLFELIENEGMDYLLIFTCLLTNR